MSSNVNIMSFQSDYLEVKDMKTYSRKSTHPWFSSQFERSMQINCKIIFNCQIGTANQNMFDCWRLVGNMVLEVSFPRSYLDSPTLQKK